MEPSNNRKIYDIGANNGDDTEYYLAKGFNVVAVDANPEMYAQCRTRFASQIAEGRLTLLNVGVGPTAASRKFYVNAAEPAISTFVPNHFADKSWVRQEWSCVDVPVVPLSELISRHGAPHYIKIDVEFLDDVVLRDLFQANVRPPYISVEAQEFVVLQTLTEMGYDRFQLVVGETVHQRFARVSVACLDGGSIEYRFPRYSTGPFGEDLPDCWVASEAARQLLLEHGPGWIDVHASLTTT